jgi:succinate dehydrogenase / fumarate reductase cytochrome b subunit
MSAVAQRATAAPRPRPRTRLRRLVSSSIGLKIIVAVTGVVLSLFVLGHMIGNLQVFQGAESINDYSKLLHKEPSLLWTARVILLTAVGLHIWAIVVLTRLNQVARAGGYRERTFRESSLASRSMRISGVLLLAFIVYHILHLTTGTVHPDYHEGDVYRNLVSGLSVLPVAVIYALAMVALGFHLWHGVWSLFQTLGVGQARYESAGRRFATVFTLAVVLGFVAVPLAALAGVFK